MSSSPAKGPKKSAEHSKHSVLSSHNAARLHASAPTPSATMASSAATPSSKTTVRIPQESGSVCATCRLSVALNPGGSCNACVTLEKARARERKKKESAKRKKSSVSDPSATRKSLPMVSMDASGGGGSAVAKKADSGPSTPTESFVSSHVAKKLKLSSLPATTVPIPATKTASATKTAMSTPLQTQFQTDKHLYAKLRLNKLHSLSTKRQLNFTGSYSVIKDPKTRNTELIIAVFGAVKDHGCVRFKRDAIGSSANDRPRLSFTERLCACQKDCGGRVIVSVVDDDETHPLGFKGQKITVKVKH
ncbi:hypothetical protein BDN71DRAFT_1457577 [Pleurotus eryngii]|uniref:Uncharacterized protein n=1 Tax=Pleurotus eryngii TaxID=5323 RepID=A0A9P5ZIW9_PLEER|nr:hypothetical protein BDN71DRAFT_1457577 [Pleurotus eryngii]